MVSINTVTGLAVFVKYLQNIRASLYAILSDLIVKFIECAGWYHRRRWWNLNCLAGSADWVIKLTIGTKDLTLTRSCVIKLLDGTLMALRNALSRQVIKYLLAFTFDWAPNPDTDMILSIIPCNCAVAIMLALVSLLVQTLVVFALVFELWKGRWATFLIWRKPLKSVIAYIFTFFERSVVALVAFTSIKFFKGITFSLLFVVNLVRFANWYAFFHTLIIFFVILAWNAFGKVLNIMSVFGTRFALISELIPQRSHFGTRLATAGLSVDNRLIKRTGFTQFIHGVPSWLIVGTHTDTWSSLVARFDGCKTYT